MSPSSSAFSATPGLWLPPISKGFNPLNHAAQVPPPQPTTQQSINGAGQFDIFEWHPAYQSCQRYFVDHAQYDNSVQAVASLVNISLPHQWLQNPVFSCSPPQSNGQQNTTPPTMTNGTNAVPNGNTPPIYMPSRDAPPSPCISLVPYIRRLVVTGFDREPVLHGFFGDDWRKGIGPMQECERRNYLFTAKSGGWTQVKSQYDMGPHETVPFLEPPQNLQLAEIENAEKLWGQWLAVEDWMVGPRAPPSTDGYARSEMHSSHQSAREGF